ncbi:FAD-dependent oxidoreductase [Hominifimenecus sp. rT4P-3]|uniref:FAD-dependent oxidoreductase n=1 Tax=Hominifimenecus sp. rT4P-3 TaxID=3242979 RepID=UPI003DA53000
MKVVIVGGVAGGASAAARLRRLDEQAEIIMLEKGEHISYANCGLPYHIGGVIVDEDELLLQTPESFYQRFRVQVRVRHEVISIQKEAKTVRVRNLADGTEYEETYDKLILSPGAEPFVPPMEGAALPRVFTLRNVADMRRIRQAVDHQACQKAVVIGGGFIGLELCENLAERGIQVSVVEAAPQILAPYDAEMARILQTRMEEAGICFYLNAQARAIREGENGYLVELPEQKVLECDFVVLAIGVRPDSGLAKTAGLDLNARGGIQTNEYMETSERDIYAVGDAIEIKNAVLKSKGMTPLAGPANKQGRLAAGNLVGARETYPGTVGSSVIKIFDLTAACTGANEKMLQAAGISYEKVYLMPLSHAGYYPGATSLALKLLFDLNGKVLGAQCVGESGVEKRIDVIASVLHFGGNVKDLTQLDLCYAPPYSSAKDPVNFAGYVAENVLGGLSPIWHWHELPKLDEQEITLLDVRTEEEYGEGHLRHSVNIPVDELRERIGELDREKPIYLYCQVGIRGYIAQRILMQNGYTVWNLSGGYGFLSKIGVAPQG